MIKNDLEKFYTVWEFCNDSRDYIEETKYKTVSRYLIDGWRQWGQKTGKIETIDYEGSPCHIVIHFPWEGHKHLSIWLEGKDKKASLLEKLKEAEDRALRYIREMAKT